MIRIIYMTADEDDDLHLSDRRRIIILETRFDEHVGIQRETIATRHST